MKALNRACKDLPDGYNIALIAENGAAWVELHTPDGIQDVDHGDDLADGIINALEQAIKDGGDDV